IPPHLGNDVRVDHLDREAAREAIEAPVWAWDRALEPGAAPYYVDGALVQALLAAGGDRIEAPFLQLVLERLWQATVADGAQVLTIARLESLGGPGRIVESFALDSLGHLNRREPPTVHD